MKNTHRSSISDALKKGLHERGISTRSVVAFCIFGIIILVFVLSDLTGNGNGSSSIGSAAEVNGQIISIKDFQDEESRLSQYYSQLFGGQIDISKQQALLRGEVMNTLINKALASQAAEKEGIYATDAEIRHMITEELPYFKKDGVFQSDAYKAILTANRLTPSEFEKKLRQDILGQRSRQLFETSLDVSDLQEKANLELQSNQLNLEYVTLNAIEFVKAHPVTEEMVAKKIADAEFKKKVADYFNTNKTEFATKEQVRASHILIQSKSDEASLKEAKAKAEALLVRLKKEDFGRIAAQVSDDPGSKIKNGDLGYFERGRMMKEFEDSAFSLSIGQVSQLVKTSYGFHIIKVTDKKSATEANLSAVESQIAKRLIENEEFSSFIKLVESALNSGKTDDALQAIAQNKLTWKETGFFNLASETVPGIKSTQALKTAVELNKSNPVAKKLVREGDSQYLLKFKEAKIQSVPELNKQNSDDRQKGLAAYSLWVESFGKKAKIETNDSLLRQQ